jgi:ferredoxin
MRNDRPPQEGHPDLPGGMPTVLVLLCESLGEPPLGLDLPALRHWLEKTQTAVQVDVVPDLCRRPKELSRATSVGAERLVIGLCSGDHSEPEMQYRARKAGVDPLAVERVNLGDFCALPHQGKQATDKARLLLAAAVTRTRAFLGSGPDDVKPYLLREHGRVSRRALFTLPPIGYRPVTSIVAGRCASEAGCELCAGVCPTGALSRLDGRMTVNRQACVACGVCVAECPLGAIHLPGQSRSQLENEIAELLTNPALDDPSQSRAPLFLCQRSASALESVAREGFSYPTGWLPVAVPCAGMVTVTMILRSFALGAAAVGVLACSGRCPYGQGERVAGRLDYCREFLRVVGHSQADVRFLDRSEDTSVLAQELRRPFEPPTNEAEASPHGFLSGALAAAEVHRALGARGGRAQDVSLSHPHSPFGAVHVEAPICTGCGTCAQTCPTEALTLEEAHGSVSLVFDPVLCTGCGQCVARCPERVIRVEKTTDLDTLAAGRVPLYDDRSEQCESCGAVIGSTAMLRRVQDLLSRDVGSSEATISTITRLCPSCRIVATQGPSPSEPLPTGSRRGGHSSAKSERAIPPFAR